MLRLKNLLILIICSCAMAMGQETSTDSTASQAVEIVVPTVDSAVVRARLKAIERSVPLNYNKYVHGFIDFFTYRKPSFTKSMLERRDIFFPIFEKYLKDYDLPEEIKYLSIIESALNPKAVSYAGAVGLWQFMPKTGKIDFGLQIDKYIDERQHITRSTVAACKYMKQLYRIFGDWELVLAAYNTGPGNVRRAIRKAGGGGFWEIYRYLHPQTRSYVPQYVAMVYMMHHAADHNIFPEKIETLPSASPVLVSNYLNLKTLASLGNIPFEQLQKVNPHILKGELPETTKDFLLAIPNEYYAYFDANKQMILDSASKRFQPFKKPVTVDSSLIASNDDDEIALESPEELEKIIKKKPKLQYHTVRRGENLSNIARKYHVAMYDIKVWNNLRRVNSVRSGQRLKIYKESKEVVYKSKKPKIEQSSTQEPEEEVVVTKTETKSKKIKIEDKEVAQEDKSISFTKNTHTVKRGETLFKIASKYNVSMGDLKEWNNLNARGSVQVGQKLKIFGKPQDNEEFVKVEKTNKKNKSAEKELSVERNPKYHKVNRGDTIWSIVQKYDGLTVDKLRKLNGIKNDNIKQGQKLRIS